MIEHIHTLRVQYPDTDQMGTVHHSVYVTYYETARWELFRSIGLPYSAIEDAGYLLPVITMSFKFIKKTHYDELLKIKTTLKAMKRVRIWFSYQLHNENDELINEAETELAFIRKDTWSPCLMPDFVKEAIYDHMNSEV